jgi:hypothetical protein
VASDAFDRSYVKEPLSSQIWSISVIEHVADSPRCLGPRGLSEHI